MESAKLLRVASLPCPHYSSAIPSASSCRKLTVRGDQGWLRGFVGFRIESWLELRERAPRSRSGKYKISRRQRARPASKPDADYSHAEEARGISWRGAKKICRGKKRAHPTVINSRTEVYARNNVGAREEERAVKGCSKDVRDFV